MLTKIELSYPGKEPEEQILGAKPRAVLQKIDSSGNLRIDNWENRLIFGDNLSALQILIRNRTIKNKVKLVYIDPPFSTKQVFRRGANRTSTISKSNDDIRAYSDILVGHDFIEFLRKRIILLRELMSNDGSIYVHIDNKMGHYVKLIMDEIFGQERFINDIARIKCNPKNFARKAFGNIKDMVLFYSKSSNYTWNDPRDQLTEEDIQRLFPKIDGEGRRYTTTPLHAPGETRNGPTGALWQGIKPPAGRHWRCKPDELERLNKAGRIEWSANGNPRKKIYAYEVIARGKKRQDIWEFKDHPYPSYPTEKNIEMLKMLIQTSSNPGDLIIDCFSGSGSTLIAAEETQRRWIGIDNSEIAMTVFQNKIRLLNNYSYYGYYHII